MEWYLKVLRQYADFNGRARRKEFWIFILISGIISWITVALDYALGTNIEDSTIGIINIIYGLAILIPYLAVTIRRLHDIGKSGWMFLIILIPLVGPVWLIILWAKDGDSTENKYGLNPKEDKGGDESETNLKEDVEKPEKIEGEDEIKIKGKDIESNDSFSNIIILLLISAFIGCGSYAILDITKILDGLQNADKIKNVTLLVFFLFSFILLLISNLKRADNSY